MKESNRSFGNLRRSTLAGFIALATLGLAAAALGYGKDGHETVGAIAADLLQGTHAETKVNNLLQGMSLLDAATWADRAKGSQGPLTQEMKDFVAANHDHHNYHYTDVPIQELQYQLGRVGTSPVDIVQISTQCINVLKGNDTPATNPHGFNQRIALLLLTHFVGDIHQPLHVGAAYLNDKPRFVNPNVVTTGVHEDQGGNFLKLGGTLLHVYWDDNAVQRAMKKAGAKSTQDYADRILQNNPIVPQTPGSVETWPKQWADEILPIAVKAHKGFKIAKPATVTDLFGTHLQWKVTAPSGYTNFARDTVDERLTTAGFRLAQLLQTIWP
ncbi:MAG TPA: S1/P1 nuclease [Candidatus Angelobacter sp.]|nr:S1/P1 nuclease [Candidatus Angelobacter sp.]